MYSAPSLATSAKRSVWPIAAICCLGLIAFLIAATIVLALIPVYLPRRTTTVNNNIAPNNDTFYLEYESNGNENTSYTGTVDNASQLEQDMNQALGLNDDLAIESVQTQTAFVRRRRRNLFFHHHKRSVKNKCLFKCKPKYKKSCYSSNCRDRVKKRIRDACENKRNIQNLPFVIRNKQFGTRTIRLSLSFVAYLLTEPIGFGGEPSTLGQFVAVNSGEFNNPSTWSQSIVPYGECSIIIPSGVTVKISNPEIDLRIRKIDIYGTLALGSSKSPNFIFNYAPNIIVYSGGKLQDTTNNKRIRCPVGTLITIYSGGTFEGSNTILQTFKSLSNTDDGSAQITLGSNLPGPFTCGILSTSMILNFQKVTYIIWKSGDFNDSNVWLGGVTPTEDVCNSVNDCDLYITSTYILSTSSLNNNFKIKFQSIIINQDAALELGTTSVSDGFTFHFPINLIVLSGGKLEDKTSSHKFYCRPDTVFIFYPGATAVASDTTVYSYTSLPATGSLVKSFKIPGTVPGPFTLGILADGTLLIFSKVTFITARSGDFSDSLTWLGRLIPTIDVCSIVAGCDLYVTSNTILSTTSLNNEFNINIAQIFINSGSSFQLGSTSNSEGFTFHFPINLIVLSGGKLEDKTGRQRLYCRHGSLFTFYPGALFTGLNTQIFSYTSLPATGSLGNSYTFGSRLSGPFTFGILFGGRILTFARVAFIAALSGSFTSTTTWLGGIVPTADICSLVNGCELYIASGCTLSTDNFNGLLDINFSFITVAIGGIFQLGKAGVHTGFKFKFPVIFDCYGTLEDVSGGNGGIYIPAGSNINFFAGGRFLSAVRTFLRIFDVISGLIIGTPLTLDALIVGPYFINILESGAIVISRIPPGNTTTSTFTTSSSSTIAVTTGLLG